MEINELEKLKTLLDKGLDVKQIADEMHISVFRLRKKLKDYGLKAEEFVDVKGKSYGSERLYACLREAFHNYKIEDEFNLGDQLKLDFYMPEWSVGVEFDGVQHFKFIPHFHGSMSEFLRQKGLDKKKEMLCEMRGVKVVRFSYKEEDDLTPDYVMHKIVSAIKGEEND